MDGAQYYDRIAHATAALTLRGYKVRQSSIASMLTLIQAMEYNLRMGFGESKAYSGGAGDPKQGSCQGNTASHAAWQQISSVLVRAQERAGHGIQLVTLITKKSRKQVGVLFVDDTNLWEGIGEDDDIDAVMEKARAVSTCFNLQRK